MISKCVISNGEIDAIAFLGISLAIQIRIIRAPQIQHYWAHFTENLKTLKIHMRTQIRIRTSFQQPQSPQLPTTPPLPTPPPLSSPIDYTKLLQVRLKEAKQWLHDNLSKTCCTASILYQVTYTSLYSSINRPKRHTHGSHSKDHLYLY
jgi:hypothetical protein